MQEYFQIVDDRYQHTCTSIDQTYSGPADDRQTVDVSLMTMRVCRLPRESDRRRRGRLWSPCQPLLGSLLCFIFSFFCVLCFFSETFCSCSHSFKDCALWDPLGQISTGSDLTYTRWLDFLCFYFGTLLPVPRSKTPYDRYLQSFHFDLRSVPCNLAIHHRPIATYSE